MGITTRTIDELGRVVLPLEVRKALDLVEKTEVEIWAEQENNRIIIQKSKASCLYCGNSENLKEYLGKYTCTSCLDKLFKI